MIKSPGRRRRRRDKSMSSRSYESNPELELEMARADRSELSRAEVVEASIVEEPSNSSQLEVKVECPISKAKAQQATTSKLEVKFEKPISNANAQQSSGGEKDYRRLILYKAALSGDWGTVALDLRSDISAARLSLTIRGDTLLHIAALAKQTAIVRMLVRYLSVEDLEFMNRDGATAFLSAAASGDVEIAKIMYERNNTLPRIRDRFGRSPIEAAALMGNRKMVEYLYKITPLEDFNAEERMTIIVATINGEMYDIALKILTEDRSIVTYPDDVRGRALQELAQKHFSYYGTSSGRGFKEIYGSIQKQRQADQLIKELFTLIMTLEDEDILDIFKKTPILADAAKIGNVEFLNLLISSYPDLIWITNSERDQYTIFHVAVINRQEKVLSLIYNIGVIKDTVLSFKDDSDNNILHLAAKLAPESRLNIVSGAAFQMQRELFWFKEVEKIVQPSYVHMKNNEGKTPRELFTEEHKKLREAGERWMKETAVTTFLVVATLIATVAFAAAFTVPGGNQEETGAPIYLNNRWFTFFAISDAVAMFSSTASIMMFLSILTSRYREDDFLFTLPAKLMVGIIMLFVSIVCMCFTFSATFFLVYKEDKEGTLPKIVAGLVLLPITLYAILNSGFWISLIHSTIWASRSMFQPGKHRLF